MNTQAEPTTITPDAVDSLPALFHERVTRTPEGIAYQYFDARTQDWKRSTWSEMADGVARWQAALLNEALQPGDKIAIMLPNCREWVMMEQAALGVGLVVVPLFANDRAANVSYILQDAGIKLLLVEGSEHLIELQTIRSQLDGLVRLITLRTCEESSSFGRCQWVEDWLPDQGKGLNKLKLDRGQLATIVYTSGTTGRPKGVMLSHQNILSNAFAGINAIPVYASDLFLSFLPLSHMLERTAGYYIPMITGATVAFARSVAQLGEDLLTIRPTAMISVPRIYEKVYGKIHDQLRGKSALARGLFNQAVKVGWHRFQHQQGRAPWGPSLIFWPLLNRLVASKIMAKLGGRLRLAMCGGAPLSTEVAKTFIGLGLNLSQGYGLTETSPVIGVNPLHDNDPASVGPPLQGIEVRTADNGELLCRGDCNMLGYWNNQQATSEIIDAEGWLHTGDKALIKDRHIYITGRLKEIIVLSNGEKVPPSDIELAITMDPIFDQLLLIGENRPFLSALTVLNPEQWQQTAKKLHLDLENTAALQDDNLINTLLEKIQSRLRDFPGYANIHRIAVSPQPWTIENGLITPTLKLRREQIQAQYHDMVEALYAGH